MLVNLSTRTPEVQAKIKQNIGPPFTLNERQKIKGVRSERFFITGCSLQIRNLLIFNDTPSSCQIELRPGGILLKLRSSLSRFGLIIPYFKLKMVKGSPREYKIWRDTYFVKIRADQKSAHQFMRKIQEQKASHWSSS